jgi:predicted acyltransferase
MTEIRTDRLVSLDVFRGATIAAMILVNNPGDWGNVFAPFLHAEWHGWTFTDLIFPFFLYIVGVAIVYAFSKRNLAEAPKSRLYKKIIRRSLILFGLGLFLNGFPYYDFSIIRIPGVLQRIAVCYFIVSLIYLHSGKRAQWIWAVSLLLAYWAFMAWYPLPEIGSGILEKGRNFSAYIDQLLLSGHMWSVSKTWDPEGVFSTLPAISMTLFGVLTGHLLRSDKNSLEKTITMFLYGNLALWVGLIWNQWLPINKNLWTSSYTVFMTGMALIVLAFCYYIADVKGYRQWTKPFIIYGMNAITIFVLSGIIGRLLFLIKVDEEGLTLKNYIYHSLFASWLEPKVASLTFAFCFILFLYGIAWLLHRKKIFIKI